MEDKLKYYLEDKQINELIKKIKALRLTFDPEKHILSFVHKEKDRVEHQILTDWFDLNFTDSYIWFVYRINKSDLYNQGFECSRYKNLKVENISNPKIIDRSIIYRKGETR